METAAKDSSEIATNLALIINQLDSLKDRLVEDEVSCDSSVILASYVHIFLLSNAYSHYTVHPIHI